jgi:DNA repair exonuclease SbcCD ATPase subunit
MNVETIEIENLMSHAGTIVELPDSGIVLVTGSNGSGKSTLIEAVSVAAFGKTLRGTDPWVDGKEGVAAIATDTLTVSRRHSAKGRTTLRWTDLDDMEAKEFESTTKAAEELEAHLGTLEVWKRSHVFSSQDMSSFTTATDAERKRLLESVLGIDKFDDALAKVRAEMKPLGERRVRLSIDITNDTIRMAELQNRLSDAKRTLSTLPPALDEAEAVAKVRSYNELLKTIEADIVEARATLREATRLAMVWDADQRKIKSGRCPTCGREVVGDGAPAGASGPRPEPPAGIEEELAELEAEQNALRMKRDDLSAALRNYAAVASSRTQAQEAMQECEEKIASIGEHLIVLTTEANLAELEMAELEACERVLGMRGVRATRLSDALAALESAANAWLERLAQKGLTLRLLPYAEKKTGGVSDCISLLVEGAGGGKGYRAASGGERRRIDVAVMFALASVAAHAYGRKPGTLFLDEALDTLDTDGIEAMVSVLQHISTQRAVVVISHNEELAARLDPVKRLRVKDGVVQ